MPLYIPYALTGTWHLGRSLCRLWLVMDYLMCTASVFNIVLISYDRFLLDPELEQKEAEKFLLRAVELVSVRDGPLATIAGLHDFVSDETLSSASDEGDDAPGLGKPQNLQDRLLLLACSQSCTLPRRWRRWMLWKMCTLK
ncbi:hypothetical protein EK904_007523 [Melospiza melodia maxima]|nr:hypothetical protein EK904_007523 [Melospiza melodia maxima]